jgi:hypothetical protein
MTIMNNTIFLLLYHRLVLMVWAWNRANLLQSASLSDYRT